jgi:hypothetical protein
MGVIDYILLAFLCGVIAVAVAWRRSTTTRVVAVLVLVGVSWFAVLSLSIFAPRWAVSLHEYQGKTWSPENRDGMEAAFSVAGPHYPYLLLSSLGLGVIALLSPRKTRP